MVAARIPLNGRVNLGRTLPDLVNLQRAGLLAGHPRRAHKHAWERDAGDRRFLREQTVYDLDRDMTANDIAADQRNVTGLKAVGDAVFLAHYCQIVSWHRRHLEPLVAKVVRISLAAAALGVLVECDLSSIDGRFCVQPQDTGSPSNQGDTTHCTD